MRSAITLGASDCVEPTDGVSNGLSDIRGGRETPPKPWAPAAQVTGGLAAGEDPPRQASGRRGRCARLSLGPAADRSRIAHRRVATTPLQTALPTIAERHDLHCCRITSARASPSVTAVAL
jgi:hypothetical protein